ncbi:G-protein coupled receptor 35-like [Heteronotia binoei]|uniref:G-protein coupled receptor 35-like n=1 Tax=Heteronotia binoei TaxID=13085 RepID=UPI00292CA6C8|nr:G-protein coupled receptor 35-like [Heteronotia binoei]
MTLSVRPHHPKTTRECTAHRRGPSPIKTAAAAKDAASEPGERPAPKRLHLPAKTATAATDAASEPGEHQAPKRLPSPAKTATAAKDAATAAATDTASKPQAPESPQDRANPDEEARPPPPQNSKPMKISSTLQSRSSTELSAKGGEQQSEVMNSKKNYTVQAGACNHTYIDDIQIIIYIPVFFIGVILNALALRVFCCKLSKWTETRVYMINLAIADCLIPFTLPFKLISKSTNVDTLCLVLESAYFINRYMSIFLITITAVDRYITIWYPFKAKQIRSPQKSAFVCGILWTLMVSIVWLNKSQEERDRPGCCFKKTSRQPFKTVLASTIWGFFIPLTILSFCSIQITRKLTKKKKSNPHEEKLIQKSINIISANMTVFVICFLPINMANIVRFIADYSNATCITVNHIDIFVNAAGIIANTNCCLDAICYYLVNKEFQEATKKLAPRYFLSYNKSSENQESEIM